MVCSSSIRTSTANAPCPTAGSISSTENTCAALASTPSRANPASANTAPSYSPPSTLRIRVSTLPRISVGTTSCRSSRNCTARRLALVPIHAPEGRSASRSPSRVTSASRASSRFGIAASTSSDARSVGRSFRLCTAISMSPLSNASSIAFVKTPSPPISLSGALVRSPSVLISRISSEIPGCARRIASATIVVCRSASLLARVPILSVRIVPC